MRLDYVLYTVAIIFFILTGGILASTSMLEDFERKLGVVTTVILGLLFIGLGYSQRPKTKVAAFEQLPSAPTAVTETAKPVEVEAAPAAPELTQVKGIGEKRAEQLKAVGINHVEDLAKASAKDLAVKLKISPKITRRWIRSAKKITEKS